MRNNIILIGFMGAGKTTIGKKLAGRLKSQLIDTDQLIEKKMGMTITELFAAKGETAFRNIETGVLRDLLCDESHNVISAGGGLPLWEENRAILKELGMVIFLRISRATVLQRLEGDDTRPLLMVENVADKVDALLSVRNPIYQAVADKVIDVDNKGFQSILEEVDEIISTQWAES